MTSYSTRLTLAANAAELAGYHHTAAALVAMLKQEHKTQAEPRSDNPTE